MIGLAGTRADPVMVHFAAHCLRAEVAFSVLDLVDLAESGGWDLSAPPRDTDRVTGSEVVDLDDLIGVYVRPIPVGPTAHRPRWRGLIDGFTCWLEETDITVVNRPGSHQLNSYKPAHYGWLAANGLLVPASLVTCDEARVRTFLDRGRAVVKPLSGVRATTREITAQSVRRLATTEGPLLIQRLVPGDDVRVHVLGREVVAARFSSLAIDYRSDRQASRSRVDIPDELADQLVRLTAAQGLAMAGWDFKVDADGVYWCLECNPMPGYSFYDRVCDGAISDALIRLLQLG